MVVVSRSKARPSRPTPGRDASGGACAASGLAPRGWGDTGRLRCCCGSGPDPSSRRRLTEADRSGAIKPHRSCWSPVAFGLTAPARSAWLRPPTRRGIRDLAPCGGVGHGPRIGALIPAAAGLADDRGVRLGLIPAAAMVAGVVRYRCPIPMEGRSRIPRRVGGRSQSARAGGVQPDEAVPQQRVIRLDTTRPG